MIVKNELKFSLYKTVIMQTPKIKKQLPIFVMKGIKSKKTKTKLKLKPIYTKHFTRSKDFWKIRISYTY